MDDEPGVGDATNVGHHERTQQAHANTAVTLCFPTRVRQARTGHARYTRARTYQVGRFGRNWGRLQGAAPRHQPPRVQPLATCQAWVQYDRRRPPGSAPSITQCQCHSIRHARHSPLAQLCMLARWLWARARPIHPSEGQTTLRQARGGNGEGAFIAGGTIPPAAIASSLKL